MFEFKAFKSVISKWCLVE